MLSGSVGDTRSTGDIGFPEAAMEDDRARFVGELTRHQTRLRGFLRCLLVRPSDVDDLLQDVNAVLWQKAGEYRPGTDFWSWASQVARYKAFNQLRRYGRDRVVFDDSLLADLATVAMEKARDLDRRAEALDHCLGRLPAPQRQLVDLRYAAGQTVEAMSRAIGRPEGSLRQALYRIRTALLACIESRLAAAGEVP